METIYNFNSQIVIDKKELPSFSDNQIHDEPMLFNCSLEAGYELGGPITKAFIDSCNLKEGVIDSRVHMLMPGWWPAIPGWHHDDVPRSGFNGQPNYDNPEYKAKHVMGLVNGQICPTIFALGNCSLAKVPDGEIVYKHWHKEVDQLVDNKTLSLYEVSGNKIIWFDWQSFHQAQKAKGSGWRWFGRISFNTNRVPTNQIRKQVQVYLDYAYEGW